MIELLKINAKKTLKTRKKATKFKVKSAQVFNVKRFNHSEK